jgi:hypothetical protein
MVSWSRKMYKVVGSIELLDGQEIPLHFHETYYSLESACADGLAAGAPFTVYLGDEEVLSWRPAA